LYFYQPEVNYWELFDLAKDPRELTSVYGQEEYAKVQQELSEELKRLRSKLQVPDPDPPGTMIQRTPAKKKM